MELLQECPTNDFRCWFNMTGFGMEHIYWQLKVMKYYSFKQKLYSLFASQESTKIVAIKTVPVRKDTISYSMTHFFTLICIFPCSIPLFALNLFCFVLKYHLFNLILRERNNIFFIFVCSVKTPARKFSQLNKYFTE